MCWAAIASTDTMSEVIQSPSWEDCSVFGRYLSHKVAGVCNNVAPDPAALHVTRVGGIQAKGQQQRQGKVGEVEGVCGLQAGGGQPGRWMSLLMQLWSINIVY